MYATLRYSPKIMSWLYAQQFTEIQDTIVQNYGQFTNLNKAYMISDNTFTKENVQTLSEECNSGEIETLLQKCFEIWCILRGGHGME